MTNPVRWAASELAKVFKFEPSSNAVRASGYCGTAQTKWNAKCRFFEHLMYKPG